MAQIYVCIGSNVRRANNIALAIDELQQRFGGLRVSSVYESESVGFDGDSFYNVVVGFVSDYTPWELISDFRRIEAKSGRKRNDPRFGPRTLDLDLLLYDDQIINRNGVVIPRKEISMYAFVLRPLAEIAGGRRHPIAGVSYNELWSRFDHSDQVVKRVAARISDAVRHDRISRTQSAHGQQAVAQRRADG